MDTYVQGRSPNIMPIIQIFEDGLQHRLQHPNALIAIQSSACHCIPGIVTALLRSQTHLLQEHCFASSKLNRLLPCAISSARRCTLSPLPPLPFPSLQWKPPKRQFSRRKLKPPDNRPPARPLLTSIPPSFRNTHTLPSHIPLSLLSYLPLRLTFALLCFALRLSFYTSVRTSASGADRFKLYKRYPTLPYHTLPFAYFTYSKRASEQGGLYPCLRHGHGKQDDVWLFSFCVISFHSFHLIYILP